MSTTSGIQQVGTRRRWKERSENSPVTRWSWRLRLTTLYIVILLRLTSHRHTRWSRSFRITKWVAVLAMSSAWNPKGEGEGGVRVHIPTLECGFCGEDIPLTPQNTVVATFTEEPDYNYVLAQCPCSGWNRNYIDASTVKMLLSKKIPVIEEKYAPGEVRESYCIACDIPMASFKELTSSEEHLVEYFRWLLERGDQCEPL